MRKIYTLLLSPKPFNIILPLLMIYLVAGTVAQKFIGVYSATQIFFSSIILWLGYIPLPGLPVLLFIIFINLLAKLIFKSPWIGRNAGIIIAHIGALLLLVGGLFTALFSEEGYMDFYIGQSKNSVSDYHHREFVLLADDEYYKNDKRSATTTTQSSAAAKPIWGMDYDQGEIKPGLLIPVTKAGIKIRILESCLNCKIVARDSDASGGDNQETNYYGIAKNMKLVPDMAKKQDEENLTGITFAVTGADTGSNGIYAVLDEVPKLPQITIKGKKYKFVMRKKQRPLPFTVRLVDFEKDVYMGTNKAKSYKSRVVIEEGGKRWESTISMNSPLRYKGYSLFQSSFVKTPAGDMSVLAVVHNAGRVFPYISGIALCFGIILHIIIRLSSRNKQGKTKQAKNIKQSDDGLPLMQKKKDESKGKLRALGSLTIFTIILTYSMLLLSTPLAAETTKQKGINSGGNSDRKPQSLALNMRDFATTPILHDGRIKPLDSFARAILKKISGNDRLAEVSAIKWLSEVIFDPARAQSRDMFRVRNPQLLSMLSLPKRKTRLYNMVEISGALSKKQDTVISILNSPEKSWSPAQKDLIALQENMVTIDRLMSSISLFLPLSAVLPANVPDSLKPFSRKTLTYMDILKFNERLDDEVKKIIKSKGQDIDSYSDAEQAIVYLSYSAAQLRSKGRKSTILKVIPNSDKSANTWFSPWQVTDEGIGTPQNAKLFDIWKNLAASYHRADTNSWNKLSNALKTDTIELAGNNIRIDALNIEYIYNLIDPFKISFILYAIAVFSLAASLFIKSKETNSAHVSSSISAPMPVPILTLNKADIIIKSTSFWLCLLGLLTHSAGLLARIYILQRPPVSTLYESIIFVSVISVAYALILYIKDKKTIWLFLASFAGIVLGLLGFSHNTDSDSMIMLSAVLNTNFWLSTHVLCISTGYGFCIITALLAHFALIRAAIDRKEVKYRQDDGISQKIYMASLLALLFCTLGTILGGVWADQSWGRFWGWDPKENGALLLVLWLLWVIHCRISGQMSPLLYLAAMSYLSVILTLSWFGVNLLSVGLHAYGFTNAAAWIFWAFIAAETAFIASITAYISIVSKVRDTKNNKKKEIKAGT